MFKKYVRVRERNQITLPAEFVAELALAPGDFLELASDKPGTATVRPTKLVAMGSEAAAREVAAALDSPAEAELSSEELEKELRRRKATKQVRKVEVVTG